MTIDFALDSAPFRLTGTVYGTLLNHRSALAAVGPAVEAPPYGGAPRAPVLYVKPRNTLAASGSTVAIPAEAAELEAAACLGLVIGRVACRVSEANALEHVAGYILVNDLSVPHPDYYRPALRYKARDGFCTLGAFAPRPAVADPGKLILRTYVDGALAQTSEMSGLIRSAERLLAEVTDFMTLVPGDILALGAAAPAPRVRVGQTVRIVAEPLGALECTVLRSAA